MPSATGQCKQSEWIDPDTPASACSGQADDAGRPLELVFSDEFEVAGRSFRDGEDPVWTALANFPNTQSQLNAYDDSPEFASTADGKLRLRISNTESRITHVNSTTGEWEETTRAYTSAMLQSWNKFCLTEGVIEMSAKLPGRAKQPGLWPAFWMMGNLGRATVQDSTDFTWPYSFSECPSSEDAQANQDPKKQQAINACLGQNWTRRFGLNPGQGRGAVEIDILEVKPGSKMSDYKRDKVEPGFCAPLPQEEYYRLDTQQPSLYTSLVIAPGIPLLADQRPNETSAGHPANCAPDDWNKQWYPEMKPGNWRTYGSHYGSTFNDDTGAFINKERRDAKPVRFQTDGLSAVSALPESAFTDQHVYRLEWKAGPDGYLRFSFDGKFLYQIDASTLGREVNLTEKGIPMGTLFGRELPIEPMYMIFNIDMSTVWNWDSSGCEENHCDCCTDCSNMKCWFCLAQDGGSKNSRDWLRKLCTTLPADYEIDYVRVYQRQNSTSSTVGCSPSAAPTEGWIEEHRTRYFAPYRYEPLEPVYAGGAACASDDQCGSGSRGFCQNGACRCAPDWTGPRCLARRAGAAAACELIEAELVGGGRCASNSTSACGDNGECVAEEDRWDTPSQVLQLQNGTIQPVVGLGDGRCRCFAGWADPYCRTSLPQADANSGIAAWFGEALGLGGGSSGSGRSSCVPEPSLRGEELEALIGAICGQRFIDTNFGANVVQACADVQWAPWWQPGGGRFSRCGAWPRASVVVSAVSRDVGLCCARLDGFGRGWGLNCQDTRTTFSFLLSVSGLVLVLMAFVGCLFQAHLRGEVCSSPRRGRRLVGGAGVSASAGSAARSGRVQTSGTGARRAGAGDSRGPLRSDVAEE